MQTVSIGGPIGRRAFLGAAAWLLLSRGEARAATPFGVSPSSGATSAGDSCSTSLCQSTVCQRSGSRWNARAASVATVYKDPT